MEAFDRLTALAVQMTDAPVAFITLVDAERSYWKSAAGLLREGPREDRLESSFSRHVLAADRTVVVPDASAPGRPRPVPDIDGAEVAAWMGVPLRASDDLTLGAFCVADRRARDWHPHQISALEALAGIAGGEVELRRALRETHDALLSLDRLQQASAALLAACRTTRSPISPWRGRSAPSARASRTSPCWTNPDRGSPRTGRSGSPTPSARSSTGSTSATRSCRRRRRGRGPPSGSRGTSGGGGIPAARASPPAS